MYFSRTFELGIQDCFDVVVTHGAKVKSFNKALEMLKVKPYECLMVGDNPVRDILGAKRLGMKTCLARYGWL